MTIFHVRGADGLGAFASQVAPFVSRTDLISLRGELGSGKTTFAQALLRGLGVMDEVTSPTYALIHEFRAEKGDIFHCDFYRLEGQDGHLLGLPEMFGTGIVVAEWLDHVIVALPDDRLDIEISGTGEDRTLSLTPYGAWEGKAARFAQMRAFLSTAGWDGAFCTHMRGDASSKTFSRLASGGETRVLMDWPDRPDGQPVRDGKTYCELVHLARDGRPFLAVGRFLREEAGLGAPRVFEADLDRGFLLVEDFGDDVFQSLAAQGADMAPLYRLATDALLVICKTPHGPDLGSSNGTAFRLSDYSASVLQDEANLLLQWYFRLVAGFDAPRGALDEFRALWAPHLDWLETQQRQLVLRDYHSPNLILKQDGEGLGKLGIIDFQDALWGHPAYDLVSLLQDARIDLPGGLEHELFEAYCRAASDTMPGFRLEDFARAYAILGAQRNSKILGVFARLHLRDGKTFYLPHMPRVRRYLRQNLQHPALAGLRAWYDDNIFAWDSRALSDTIDAQRIGTSL